MRTLATPALALVITAALAATTACSTPGDPAEAGDEKPGAIDAIVALVPEDIAAAGKIAVATTGTTPPEGYKEADGTLAGYEIEIVEAAAALMGLEVDWQLTDFASMIPGIQSGRYTLAVGQMGITAERAEMIDFVTLIDVNQAFAAKESLGLSGITIEDLCGRTVAIVQGSRQQEFGTTQSEECVADGKPAIDLAVFQSNNEGWLALQSDRAELFWSGATAVAYLVSQAEGSEIVGHHLTPYPTGIALADDGPIGPALEAAMQELTESGEYLKILDSWNLADRARDEAILNPQITW